MFISSSAMMLHLEVGNCEAQIYTDLIEEIALDCSQSERYTCDDDSKFNFECPNCDARFRYMSGLLQHAESDACSAKLANGEPLGDFLHHLRVHLRNESDESDEDFESNQSSGGYYSLYPFAGYSHFNVGDDHALCDKDCGWCGHCADGY